jgi:hypothetical protein
MGQVIMPGNTFDPSGSGGERPPTAKATMYVFLRSVFAFINQRRLDVCSPDLTSRNSPPQNQPSTLRPPLVSPQLLQPQVIRPLNKFSPRISYYASFPAALLFPCR